MSGWNREQVLKLIQIIKERPTLYDYKHPWYKSRNARQQVLIECQEALHFVRPDTSIDEIKKKWNAIRQTYLLEKKREENSMKSGIPKDMVYTPSLFYYKEMEFLKDSIERASELTQNPEEDTDSFEGSFVISPEGNLRKEYTRHAFNEAPPPFSNGPTQSKKKKKLDHVDLAASVSLLSSCATDRLEDTEDRYAKTVADRLRGFSEKERIFIKKKIDDVFYEAFIHYKKGT